MPPEVFGSGDLLFLFNFVAFLISHYFLCRKKRIPQEASFSKVAAKCIPLLSNDVISKGRSCVIIVPLAYSQKSETHVAAILIATGSCRTFTIKEN